MNTVVSAAGEKFVMQVPLLVIGAGAAGLCAALAAKESGLDALVVERNTVPSRIDGAVGWAHSCSGHPVSAGQGDCRQP